MRNLLIEEMKRAIQIMENKEEIKRYTIEKHIGYNNREFEYPVLDREVTELQHLMKSIRRHTIILEKDIKKTGA